MPEKKQTVDESSVVQKSDLEAIIKVNSKAIEVQNLVANQFVDVITNGEEQKEILTKIDAFLTSEMKEIRKELKDIERAQFKLSMMLTSGILGLIIQLIMLFKK